jgi:hypothetical protein
MRVKAAVVTVQGKPYFHIVNLLKENDIPFFSLMPKEPIPSEAMVVITTLEERGEVEYGKVLTFTSEKE